jgi:hypothetical protein
MTPETPSSYSFPFYVPNIQLSLAWTFVLFGSVWPGHFIWNGAAREGTGPKPQEQECASPGGKVLPPVDPGEKD